MRSLALLAAALSADGIQYLRTAPPSDKTTKTAAEEDQKEAEAMKKLWDSVGKKAIDENTAATIKAMTNKEGCEKMCGVGLPKGKPKDGSSSMPSGVTVGQVLLMGEKTGAQVTSEMVYIGEKKQEQCVVFTKNCADFAKEKPQEAIGSCSADRTVKEMVEQQCGWQAEQNSLMVGGESCS